jgi:hypothetical protein
MFASITARVLFNSFVDCFSSPALLPALCGHRGGYPLGHDAAAGALTAAQAFYEGADWGVGLEAEASQDLPRQLGLMPAMQAQPILHPSHAARQHSFDADVTPL